MSEVFDIAIMGTSLTTSRADREWDLSLASTLQIGKRSKVRTYRLGFDGETSTWGLANIQPLVAKRPRIALIEFINDAYRSYQAPNPRGMTLALSKSNFEGIVDTIKLRSPDTMIYLMTLIRPRDDAHAAYYPNLVAYNEQLARIAAQRGVGFIDCYSKWGDPSLHPEDFHPTDGIHPLLEGYLRVTIPAIAGEVGDLIK